MSYQLNKTPNRLMLITCEKCGQKWEIRMELQVTEFETIDIATQRKRKSRKQMFVFPAQFQKKCNECDSRHLKKQIVKLDRDGRIPVIPKKETV